MTGIENGARTDLAIEAHEMCRSAAREVSEIDGVSSCVEKYGNVTLTRVNILNDNGSRQLGKAIGRYVTIEAANLRYDEDEYETVCGLIGDEIRAMAEIEEDDTVLVAGLGNSKITPDALGCETVDSLMITHHIKRYMSEMFDGNIGNVCAVKPGVLGTTGMETVEIIKGITDRIKPKLVIAVDALAAADIRRVSTTIQIADTGIAPGSGVGNNRDGINKETLGTRVIAVGVPTVIDAATISRVKIPDELAPLMVTTKDIDAVTERMAKTVANGINLAMHRNMSITEIENFVV